MRGNYKCYIKCERELQMLYMSLQNKNFIFKKKKKYIYKKNLRNKKMDKFHERDMAEAQQVSFNV